MAWFLNDINITFILKMEAPPFSEMPLNIYHIAPHLFPGENKLSSHRHKNLKPHITQRSKSIVF
jgi:hypothetical protein